MVPFHSSSDAFNFMALPASLQSKMSIMLPPEAMLQVSKTIYQLADHDTWKEFYLSRVVQIKNHKQSKKAPRQYERLRYLSRELQLRNPHSKPQKIYSAKQIRSLRRWVFIDQDYRDLQRHFVIFENIQESD